MGLLLIIIGWGLGIASTLGVDWFRKRSQKEDFKKGVLTEIKETRASLAVTVLILADNGYGSYNRELLEWIYSIHGKDTATPLKPKTISSLKTIIDNWSDEQIDHAAATGAFKRGTAAISLKKHSLPFLTANLSLLSSLGVDLQRKIVRIKTNLDALNQEIELAYYFWDKTFDSSLGEDSRNKVRENLNASYEHIFGLSRRLADMIERCTDALSKKKSR